MTSLLDFAIGFAGVCLITAMVFAAIRLFRGPSAQDRVLAFDTLYINGMLSMLMLGIGSRSTLYFDMALLIALFGFVGSAAFAKFLLRGEVIEP
jgi:multicomponent K+:H+ antiporter subunit F